VDWSADFVGMARNAHTKEASADRSGNVAVVTVHFPPEHLRVYRQVVWRPDW
jgi:hypothetical protein